jgi:hypothetical protein
MPIEDMESAEVVGTDFEWPDWDRYACGTGFMPGGVRERRAARIGTRHGKAHWDDEALARTAETLGAATGEELFRQGTGRTTVHLVRDAGLYERSREPVGGKDPATSVGSTPGSEDRSWTRVGVAWYRLET